MDAKGRVLSDLCIADEVPFDLPEGWEWARLSQCCDVPGADGGCGSGHANLCEAAAAWRSAR